MNNRFDIDYEWLLALHQATRYVLQTRDLEETNKRITAETQRLFSTVEVTLITDEHQKPPQPAAGQSQLVIPLITEHETFGTLYIFRDRPFTEEELDLGDEWGQSAAWALLHIKPYGRRKIFLSTLSHELMTPLTSIKGYADLLNKLDNLSVEDQKQYSRTINVSAERAITLIRDLIDQEYLNSGIMHFSPKVHQINTLLQNNEKELREKFATQEQTLIFLLQTDKSIFVDEQRFIQIIGILLDNAYKFSPPQSTITLSATTDKPKACFQVVDHGVGIDPSEHQRIFDGWYRSTDPAVHQISGYGLGLNIALQLVQKMGGEIGVTSQKGQGSTFWFTLPLAQK